MMLEVMMLEVSKCVILSKVDFINHTRPTNTDI